jgi:hypothetical protein
VEKQILIGSVSFIEADKQIRIKDLALSLEADKRKKDE